MATFDQPPGSFADFAATDEFVVGPHSRFLFNGLTMNDRTLMETYWVTSSTGFDSPDVTVSAQPNVEETGELPDPGFYGGRTMTLTGWIQAGSYPQIIRMSRLLLNAFVGLVEQPLTLSVAEASYFTQPDMIINCRPSDRPQLTTDIQDNDITGLLQRPFTITLRASDPTFRGVTENHVTLVPTVISSLGRGYDKSYDVGYTLLMTDDGDPNVSGGSSDAGNPITVINTGNWRASIVIRFTGAMTNIILVNETTGQMMFVANIDDGDWVQVDTGPNGAVVDQDGNPAGAYIDPVSDWTWLAGKLNGADGTNVLSLYVASYGVDAQLDVSWYDTTL